MGCYLTGERKKKMQTMKCTVQNIAHHMQLSCSDALMQLTYIGLYAPTLIKT